MNGFDLYPYKNALLSHKEFPVRQAPVVVVGGPDGQPAGCLLPVECSWLMNTMSANTTTTRDTVISLLKALPDDVTLEDIMYHLYVQEKILKVLNEIRDGDVI